MRTYPRPCPRVRMCAGGYLLAYENDNISPKDTLITTRLTKLTLVLEYPRKAPQPAQLWIQRCVRSSNVAALLAGQPTGSPPGRAQRPSQQTHKPLFAHSRSAV